MIDIYLYIFLFKVKYNITVRKIYYLSTCDTCRKILSQLKIENVQLIDIKKENISPEDLDFAAKITGNYESLFNKRAQKLKIMDQSERPFSDDDFRKLILKEYTFLKRPLAIVDKYVFAGNAPETIAKLKLSLEN